MITICTCTKHAFLQPCFANHEKSISFVLVIYTHLCVCVHVHVRLHKLISESSRNVYFIFERNDVYIIYVKLAFCNSLPKVFFVCVLLCLRGWCVCLCAWFPVTLNVFGS